MLFKYCKVLVPSLGLKQKWHSVLNFLFLLIFLQKPLFDLIGYGDYRFQRRVLRYGLIYFIHILVLNNTPVINFMQNIYIYIEGLFLQHNNGCMIDKMDFWVI